MTAASKGKAHAVEMGVAVMLDTLRALQLIAAHYQTPAKGKANVPAASTEDSRDFPTLAEATRAQTIGRVLSAVLKTDLAALARIAYPGFVGTLTNEQFARLGVRLKSDVAAIEALALKYDEQVNERNSQSLAPVFAVIAWRCVRGEITPGSAASLANSIRRVLPPVYATKVEEALKARKNTSPELLALRVYTVLAKGSEAHHQGMKRSGLAGDLGDLIRSVGANTALSPSRKGSVGSVVPTTWPTSNTVTDRRRASIRPPISKD